MKSIFTVLSTCVVLWAQTVSFDTVVQEAINYNIELKIIKTNIDINDAKLEEVGSLYYPTLSLSANAQYTKGLGEGEDGVTSVGDTVLNSTTQYESSIALRVDYDIYDFGVRNAKEGMAQIDRNLVDYALQERKQKVKLTLLDLYVKILSLKKQIYSHYKLKKLQKKVLHYKKRLYKAGEVDKVFVSRQSIVIANTTTKLEQIKSSLGRILTQLYFYTGKQYSLETEFKSLQTRLTTNLKYMDSWQYRELELRKEQKRKEIELLESQQYPSIKLYGRYNLYGQGSERCTIWCALYDMEARNHVIGVSASMVIFNGFQTSATKKRLQAELLQLELKDEQADQLFRQQQLEIGRNIQYVRTDINNYRNIINKQKQKSKMNGRLFNVHEVNAIVKVEDKIELVYQQLELDARLIEESAKVKELEILNEGYI